MSNDLNREPKEYKPRGRYKEATIKEMVGDIPDGTKSAFGLYKFGDRLICKDNLTEEQKLIIEELNE